jgi:hypothetical protein
MTRYPVYVISKGRFSWRAKSRPTTRVLDELGVEHHVIVEPQEYDAYSSVVDPTKLIALPFSNLGRGSIPARNWCWEDAIAHGYRRHWILDDNICHFRRLTANHKIEGDAAMFTEMEDFVDQFSNVALAGPDNVGFARADVKQYAYRLNTRVYSCILIDNAIPFRWRGRYNEDTDLALRALKSGWTTVLFKKYLMDKTTTLRNGGGNRDELYAGRDAGNIGESRSDTEGRWLMAESLRLLHPDVVKVGRRFKRWQHNVDYGAFAGNRLVRTL